MNEETQLAVLRVIGEITTQRDMASKIGYSVGKLNFVLNGLIEKGFVKAERFLNSKQKQKYKYLLAEQGFKEKVALSEKFIERKKAEYDTLVDELEKSHFDVRKENDKVVAFHQRFGAKIVGGNELDYFFQF